MPDSLLQISRQTHKVQIYIGQVKHHYGFDSAIDKETVNTCIYLSELGLENDTTADKKYHGGLERALHQYPAEHYSFWQQVFSPRNNKQPRFEAPGMGENISAIGMTEENVCIGDQYQWGEAIIEVSQPRLPCFKLNTRWNVSDISVQMQTLSRCGWLYRVIKPGMIAQSDELHLIKRLESATTVKQVCELFFSEPLNKANLIRLIEMPALTPIWGEAASKRLETNTVENWNFRLLDHP
ncbi:MOSC domain-containing protein [Moritella sp. 36]|uniref:MOSC domain-containing protein n=1 Tax=Moritella sp. 36 TaxID=2746233 RepID=UPI001BA6813A|nr:MOSC domain-containing protein [Moritella sp. 36]QUM89108.1 MOSC domain-containing protein [Moritella sp. 36]